MSNTEEVFIPIPGTWFLNPWHFLSDNTRLK